MILPPKELRQCGRMALNDADFKRTAIDDANKIIDACNIVNGSTVLEVGCGCGRIALGFIESPVRVMYDGFDVDYKAINWCQQNLRSISSNFRCLDIYNERYNPYGVVKLTHFKLPYSDIRFGAICAYSVFTHLDASDVECYLREFRRLLYGKGTVYITAFVEPYETDLPDVTVNPPGYPVGPSGQAVDTPLHRVRYSLAFFEDMIVRQGLKLKSFSHATEWNSQSVVLLGK